MSKLTQGMESLQRLALHYQDLTAAHDMLSELAGAEQAKTEMESAAANAKADLDKAKKSLADQKKKLEGMEAQAQDLVEQTNARVAELTNTAREEANKITTAAAATAEEITNVANAKAEATLAQAEAKMKEANETVTLALIEKEEYEGKIETDKKTLADLEAQIDNAKAAIKQIMGA